MRRGFVTRRSTEWRLGAALVAVACLVGHLNVLAHQLLVRHATCVEHGESVHVVSPTPPGPIDGRYGQVAPPSDRSETQATNASVFVEEHEHCSIPLSRHLATRSAHAHVVGAGPPLVPANGLRTDVRGAVVQRYVIAPKTSPPRLAS